MVSHAVELTSRVAERQSRVAEIVSAYIWNFLLAKKAGFPAFISVMMPS